MMMKAAGMLNSRTPVTATTNRTMSMFAESRSTSSGPTKTASRIVAIGATTSTSSIRGRSTLPRTVMLPQARFSVVMPAPCRERGRRSLVDASHDRVERRHDRHRVRDEVVLHQQADELEVHERRVVDLHPERLVRAVRDHVGPV